MVKEQCLVDCHCSVPGQRCHLIWGWMLWCSAPHPDCWDAYLELSSEWGLRSSSLRFTTTSPCMFISGILQASDQRLSFSTDGRQFIQDYHAVAVRIDRRFVFIIDIIVDIDNAHLYVDSATFIVFADSTWTAPKDLTGKCPFN